MITYNEGTTINIEAIPVIVNGVKIQVVNLVIKQDGNEVRLRLRDNDTYGFDASEFFIDFVNALYKEDTQSFSNSYSIHVAKPTKAEDL